MSPSSRLLLLGVCAMLAAPAAVAQADATDDLCPAPALVATDPAGDQSLFNTPVAGSNDLDLTTVRLGSNADGGARVTLDIPTLDKTVPPYATGLSWYFMYTVDGANRFASATLDPHGNVSFATGNNDSGQTGTEPASGRYTTGSPGRISIDIPDSPWGDTLSAMSANSYYDLGANTGVVNLIVGSQPSDTAAIAGTTQVPGCA